ncbi:MAG: hypothetical protein CVT77_17530, partial [Alphaproteobacteria bacterium HGW-Alphaproteobacteria-16]
RADDQVKIRGYRIEPGEIEALLSDLPGISQAAVMAVPDPAGGLRLAAWYAPEAAPEPEAVRAQLAARLPAHMVPDTFTRLARLPLTAHGKIDRAALPDPAHLPSPPSDHGSASYTAPVTGEERLLCTLLEDLTGRSRIGTEDHFFRLGGHSLLAARLAARIRAATGKTLPIRTLFQTPRIKDIADALKEMKGGDAVVRLHADPEAINDPFPLTPVQQAYWLGRQDLVALGRVACHAYSELDLTRIDPARMEAAWRATIARHPMLRAVIGTNGDQCILPVEETADRFTLPICEEAPETIRERMSRQILPLGRWPMFDVRLSRTGGEGWRLHLSLDALILDGESTALMLEEVFTRYHGTLPADPAPQASFRDYVLQAAGDPAHAEARNWWQARLDDLPPAPALPLAADPERLEDPRFGRWTVRIGPEDWAALQTRAAVAGFTPSAVLLTAWAETLATWTRSEAFSLNLTVGDRRETGPDVASMLGVFTTLVPLAVQAARTGPFEARVRTLQADLAEALDHRAFSGVEVQRLLAQKAGGTAAGLLPVVFTSLLGEAGFDPQRHGARLAHAITQTPQTWLDNKVYETPVPGGTALTIDWDAPAALFPDGLLDEMLAVYAGLVRHLARGDEAWQAPRRSLLPEAQQALIAGANATAAPLPDGLLHQMVLAAAEAHPGRIALIQGDAQVTYAGLSARVRAAAADLADRLTPQDELVAVVMEKGIEQVVAVLAVLACGRAFLPVSAGQPDLRLTAILEAAGARIALTQPRILRGRAWQDAVELIDIPEAEPSNAPDGLPPTSGISPDSLAYVIYTSGSTGAPKGVAISHRAARNTLADLEARFAIGPEDRGLWVSSLEFDLSVFDIFGLLGTGASLVIPPPDAARSPEIYATLAGTHGVTVWNSVPAIAELMLQANPDPHALSHLRLILLSGDWIPLALPPSLAEAAPEARIVSLGGATEAAIWSIFHPIDAIDADWVSIPYGCPLANQAFHVLNDSLDPCPVHVPGRLYIEGAGLALGYRNAPALTASRFIAHPRTGARLYDTGDLGARMTDGQIRFLGREDHQVKLRGFRIELAEIEKTLTQHPKIKNAAAILQTKPTPRICAVVTEEREVPEKELRDWVDTRLPDYMHPSIYVSVPEMPLTPNGKIDRKALLALVQDRQNRHVEPATPAERTLCEIVGTLLNTDQVGLADNFFHLGGDSITAIRLVHQARAKGLHFEARDVFVHPVIGALAARTGILPVPAQASRANALLPEPQVAEARAHFPDIEDAWPLTPLQKGLWYHAHCTTEGDDPYLVQIRLDLVGKVDTNRLHRALDALLVRHPGLRISFLPGTDHEPIQVVRRGLRVDWQQHDLSGERAAAKLRHAEEIECADRANRIHPDAAPLIRATLIRLSKQRHRLLITQHHLLGDGWSSGIFMRDLFDLYRSDANAAALRPAVSPQAYYAWLAYQDEAKALRTWRAYLEGYDTATLVAPTARGDILYRQETVERPMSSGLRKQVEALGRGSGLTPATILQTAWGLLVARLTGSNDVCFGTVNSGRHAPVDGIEDMLGLLLTTTPVRLRLLPREPVLLVMQRLQEEQASLLSAAHAPLTAIHREMGMPALFDTLFTYENYPLQTNPDPGKAGELPVTAITGTNGNHYPLSLAVIPDTDFLLRLHYGAGVFSEKVSGEILDRLETILKQITAAPHQTVSQINTLLNGEAERLLVQSRGARTEDVTQTLPELIEAQAAHTPEAIAVMCGAEVLTYAGLESRANRIAWALIQRGAGPEKLVALHMPRSADLLAAVLGVMKTGAAFLPIDPADPPERTAFMLEDAAPHIVMSAGHGLDPDDPEYCAELETYPITAPSNADRTAPLHSDHPAYVIYTSGSTGRPKGVTVPHRGLPNLAVAQADRLGITPDSRIVQLASFSFDAAISEIAMTLTRGATLVMAPPDARAGEPLFRLLKDQGITHATLTPTALSVTPPAPASLEAMIVAGEIASASTLAPWIAGRRVFNAYGPTEASVCATMSPPLARGEVAPIGRPLENTGAYVLDDRLQPCPVGVPGELYLSGPGLARGYRG